MSDDAELLKRYRAEAIATYKAIAEAEFAKIGENSWKWRYAAGGGGVQEEDEVTSFFKEDWDSVNPLWSGRYGGGAEDSAAYSDTDDSYANNRSAYGSKIMLDGINALENMSLEEMMTKASKSSSGSDDLRKVQVMANEMAEQQVKALLSHLSKTRDPTYEPPKMDASRNSLTGEMMAREAEATKAAQAPPNAPGGKPDTPEVPLSRAGIAYDTIEYREQCFLLSQLWKIVGHKHDIIEREDDSDISEAQKKYYPEAEYKPLPYIDEDIGNAASKDSKTPGTKKPVTNACLMVDDFSPYAFINRLTQYTSQQDYLNLTTPDLSQLQPQIRLYKIHNTFEDDGAPLEMQQEILFDTSTTAQDLKGMLKNKAKRGFGAGIKDFTINYEASNPFALKKSISATLTIFANTFDELLEDRGGYSYIDLALKTGGIKELQKMRQEHGVRMNPKEQAKYFNLSKLNFRLKAVVGWMVPPGTLINNLSSRDSKKMLYNSYVTINLTPTIHTFDFDDAGRVNFKIQYLAYVEDFFDEESYSIFNDPALALNQAKRLDDYRLIEENCDGESLQAFKEKMQKEVSQELADARTRLWRQMTRSGKVRMINMKYSTLRKFQELGPYFDLPKAEQEAWNIQNVSDDIKREQQLLKEMQKYKKTEGSAVGHKDSKNANTDRQVTLVFFYVSDLIDIILEGIEGNIQATLEHYSIQASMAAAEAADYATADIWYGEDYYNEGLELATEWFEWLRGQPTLDLNRTKLLLENFKRYRVLLGPIEIYNPAKPDESRSINLGDLPVSFKYFMEWLTSRTLQKNRPFYPISAFLNDFFNGLINGFLNDSECFSAGSATTRQATTLNQTVITSYRDDPEKSDKISELLHQYRKDYEVFTGYDVSRLHLYYHDNAHGPITEFPILNISGPQNSHVVSRDVGHEINYACYYAGRTAPKEKQRGRIGEDNANGIMHYVAGKDRGIIKNIQFQKTESPGLKELRFEQSSYDGLGQLREVYNVKIDTYANVSVFPGSYIFVDPRGLAPNLLYSGNSKTPIPSPEDLTTYGLGGYYMVVRSTHSFGEGKADTSIDAVWVAEMGREADEEMDDPTHVDEADRLTKCEIDKQGYLLGQRPPREPQDTVSKE